MKKERQLMADWLKRIKDAKTYKKLEKVGNQVIRELWKKEFPNEEKLVVEIRTAYKEHPAYILKTKHSD
jgi:hypothetical protein